MSKPTLRTFATITGSAVLAMAATLLPSTAASAATAAPPAPAGLKVARSAADADAVAISWRPVAGITHYMVRVNDGAHDREIIVPSGQTSLTYQGAGECTSYRVAVSAVASKTAMGTTPAAYVGPKAPGGIGAVTSSRSTDGATAAVTWQPPAYRGITPLLGYDVEVVDLATGAVVRQGRQAEPSVQLAGLSASSSYAARVKSVNSFGSCHTHRVLLGAVRPGAPAFQVVRDPADPSKADVTWSGYRWTGSTQITGFQVGYKRPVTKDFTWVNLPGNATTTTLTGLDPTSDWQIVMRSTAGTTSSLLSKVYTLHKTSYKPTTATVKVSSSDNVITVDFSAPVGSATNFPQASVDVALANGTTGWEDHHQVSNGAGKVTFRPVPCGTYNVQVTGTGPTGSQTMSVVKVRVCPQAPICFTSTLQNGGFESPAIPDRTYRILPATTAGLNWKNSAEGNIELWSTGYSNNSNGGVIAPEGRQFAELNANVAGTLYQDLQTVPGTTMRWHLKHRGRAGTDTMRVVVGAPGAQLQQSGPTLVTGNTGWVQYTFTYTIPAGQTTTRFGFQAVSTATGSPSVGNFLDDVVFTPEQCQ